MNKAKTLRVTGGFTLVEVLVTLVVLSIGVLGVAGLQASAMRATQSAYNDIQAAVLSQQIVAAMRANRVAAVHAGSYTTDFGDRPSCSPTASVAACDLAVWKAALNTRLPQGQGKVSLSSDHVVTVCIRWLEPRRGYRIASQPDACPEAQGGRRRFELETVL